MSHGKITEFSVQDKIDSFILRHHYRCLSNVTVMKTFKWRNNYFVRFDRHRIFALNLYTISKWHQLVFFEMGLWVLKISKWPTYITADLHCVFHKDPTYNDSLLFKTVKTTRFFVCALHLHDLSQVLLVILSLWH